MTSHRELNTTRLLLRPYRLSDVTDVLSYASDEEWARYLGMTIPDPYTEADAEQFVASTLLRPWADNPTFAIVLAGRVIGGVALKVHSADRRAELGYNVARQHWGKGLMTEAVRAVIDYAFNELELAKVVAGADSRNVGSWRVMEKAGMKREGLLRGERLGRDGSRADEVRYGLLRDGWTSSPRSGARS